MPIHALDELPRLLARTAAPLALVTGPHLGAGLPPDAIARRWALTLQAQGLDLPLPAPDDPAEVWAAALPRLHTARFAGDPALAERALRACYPARPNLSLLLLLEALDHHPDDRMLTTAAHFHLPHHPRHRALAPDEPIAPHLPADHTPLLLGFARDDVRLRPLLSHPTALCLLGDATLLARELAHLRGATGTRHSAALLAETRADLDLLHGRGDDPPDPPHAQTLKRRIAQNAALFQRHPAPRRALLARLTTPTPQPADVLPALHTREDWALALHHLPAPTALQLYPHAPPALADHPDLLWPAFHHADATNDVEAALRFGQRAAAQPAATEHAHALARYLQLAHHLEPDPVALLDRLEALGPPPLLLARAAARLGDPARADRLRRLALLDPHTSATELQQLAEHFEHTHPELAAAALEQLCELAPGFAVGHIDRGVLLHRRGDHTAAARAYRHALRLSPHHPYAAYNLAQILDDHPTTQAEALTLLRAALAHAQGHSALLHAAIGSWHMRLGDPPQARRHFDAALRQQLRDPGMLLATAIWHDRHRRDPARALDLLRRAVALHPDRRDLWFHLVAVAFAHRLPHSTRTLRAAHHRFPWDLPFGRALADHLTDHLGRHDEAEAVFRRLLHPSTPASTERALTAGHYAILLRDVRADLQATADLLLHELADHPDDPFLLGLLTECGLSAAVPLPQLAAHHANLLRLTPDDARPRLNLVRLHLAQADLPAAAAALAHARRLLPDPSPTDRVELAFYTSALTADPTAGAELDLLLAQGHRSPGWDLLPTLPPLLPHRTPAELARLHAWALLIPHPP